MAKKEIYIVRHGETAFNKSGKSQGRGIDASLNATGRAQAKAFFDRYQNEQFEKIYVSALRRTEETMSSFIDSGIPYEKLEGLDEISFGVREGRTFVEDGFDFYAMITQRWRNGELDYKFENGESPLEVVERQKKAISYILSQPEQKILICMHGRAMRILMAWLLATDLKAMDQFKHHNLGLYKLVVDGDAVTVLERNNIDHLAGLSVG